MAKKVKTSAIIEGMLKENTGIAMCDSGGTDGRMWQRNQKIASFEDTPEVTLDLNVWTDKDGKTSAEIYATISLYHHLVDNLAFDERLNKTFEKFVSLSKNDREYYLSLMPAFLEMLQKRGFEVTNMFNDRLTDRTQVIYTYNEENLLSQDIQFLGFHLNGDPYVMLQIHNGADARGGLTAPKVFKVTGTNGDAFYDFLNYSRVTLHDPETEDGWSAESYGGKFEHFENSDLDLDKFSAEKFGTERSTPLSPISGKPLVAYRY